MEILRFLELQSLKNNQHQFKKLFNKNPNFAALFYA